MRFPLDTYKTIQAAAALLRGERSREMSYMRLLKLLYMADRQSLAETGRPIVGGRQVAMDYGPVPSRVYDAIKACDPSLMHWMDFIERDCYKVRLVKDPGVARLTKYEAKTLADVSAKYAHLSDWDLVQLTHDFPEYKQHEPPKGSSLDIPWEDIVVAVGLADKLSSIQQYQRDRAAAAAALGAG